MTTDRLPLFLGLARDWRAAADILRTGGAAEGDPVLGVWREAAWCHVLFGRGQSHAALTSLRAVVWNVTGEPPLVASQPMSEVVAVFAAANLFDQMRAAVSAHHPHAFGRPAAA
jgi:hypothetical protein